MYRKLCLLVISGLVLLWGPALSAQENREAIGLEQLLVYGAENAPAMRESDARQGLGRARQEGAGRFFADNPEVEVEAGANLSAGEFAALELTLRQPVEIFGQRRLRRDHADRYTERLRAEVDQVRRQVEVAVRPAYYKALAQKERVAIEEQRVAFDAELVELTATQVELGEEAQVSEVLARAEAAGARQELIAARSRYEQGLRDLAQAVGWDQTEVVEPVGQLPRAISLPPVEELVEAALEVDPQRAALQARGDEIEAQGELSKRLVWPTPTVGLRLAHEQAADGTEQGLFFIVGAPIPLWDRNQEAQAVALAEAEVVQRAIADRRQQLARQVRGHYEVAEDANEELAIYDDEVLPAFERQLALLQEGLELGELSILDVMGARDRLLAAQRRQLQTLERLAAAAGHLEALCAVELVD